MCEFTDRQSTLPARMPETKKPGLWSKAFASMYDRVLSASEEAGLAQRRSELLGLASGRVLELGAGTGLNLNHYPESVESLVLSEPDPNMMRRLRTKVAAAPNEMFIEFSQADAGDLLFMEHVKGTGSVAWRQRIVARPWAAVACGCRCDRPTHDTLARSQLQVSELDHGRMPKAAKFLSPLIQGRAVRPNP